MMMSKVPPRPMARNAVVAAFLVMGVAVIGSYPLILRKRQEQEEKNLFASQEGLTGSQTMRGAYINSGSKDVGPDPDYDHRTGTWKGKRNDPHKQ